MTATESHNLVLRFKLAGDPQYRVCNPTRIKVDGRGAMTIYDGSSGLAEEIELTQLQSFSLHSLGLSAHAEL